MRYLGGKFRIGKQIARFLNSIREPGQGYWEPFVGSAWVLMRIQGGPNYASDANKYLIAMWQALQQGWIPPSRVTEEEYIAIRDNPNDYKAELVSFVAFGCSWGGKWFGGYARGENRNWAAEAQRSLLKKLPKLQGVRFFHSGFMNCYPPEENMLIYCDPPYQDTTGYGAIPDWDSGLFWSWVRNTTDLGHTVIVSEYIAPKDIVEVASFPTKTDLNTGSGGKETRIERLFMLRPPGKIYKQLSLFTG